MNIELDRNKCTRWQGACESCFATRMVQENFDAADCGLSVIDKANKSVLEFKIHDRDGHIKTLTVDAKNWGDAYNSWLELFRRQVGSPA